MILTPENVKQLLVSTLEKITALPPGRVIRETEAGPRPSSGLYCTLWWKTFEPLPQNGGDYAENPQYEGQPDDYDKTHPIIQHLRNETWCEVQINFWGAGAFDLAVQTLQALQSDARWFDLWKVLGFGGVDAVQDISTAFRAQIQSRCFFTLSFYACFGGDYPAEWFDTSQWEIACSGQVQEFEYSKEIKDDPDPRCLSKNAFIP